VKKACAWRIERRQAFAPRKLTFVAVWALFCVEMIRRDAKHIIALDADAMQQRLRRIAGLQVCRMRVRRCRSLSGHEQILSWPARIM
jgi:hypothetical protein